MSPDRLVFFLLLVCVTCGAEPLYMNSLEFTDAENRLWVGLALPQNLRISEDLGGSGTLIL